MSTPASSTDTTTAPATATTTAAAKQQPTKRRGSNKQPGRQRFIGRNTRGIKTLISQVELLHGRALTPRERGACASLCMPLNRDGGSGGR
jgi:hypothetical protein